MYSNLKVKYLGLLWSLIFQTAAMSPCHPSHSKLSKISTILGLQYDSHQEKTNILVSYSQRVKSIHFLLNISLYPFMLILNLLRRAVTWCYWFTSLTSALNSLHACLTQWAYSKVSWVCQSMWLSVTFTAAQYILTKTKCYNIYWHPVKLEHFLLPVRTVWVTFPCQVYPAS